LELKKIPVAKPGIEYDGVNPARIEAASIKVGDLEESHCIAPVQKTIVAASVG